MDQLEDCGPYCDYSSSTCTDENACNINHSAECIYSIDEYHDCCGECSIDIDADGICDNEDSCIGEYFECAEFSGTCGENCKIVCPPDEPDCQGDFTNIQEAINFVSDGDTVLVEQGTYYENLIIEKSITLISRAVFET
jgi:hypothetical protein